MADSSRGLLRSMMVIGSAQSVNVAISIVRMKLLALLLGPTGVGLLSIYSNLQDFCSQAAGLGLNSSGVREIASNRKDEKSLGRLRRVLMMAHVLQGGLAMLVVWLMREPISIWFFGDISKANEVGLVGVAAFLTLVSLAQVALLQGLRRIDDLGRLTVLSALVASVSGLLAVWALGIGGLIWFVLVSPLTSVIVAFYFVRRVRKPTPEILSTRQIWDIWKPMAKLGVAFMLGGIATTATVLLIRGRLLQEFGLEATGLFAAAWSVTMTYVGFMFTAMAADYYPRLTETIQDNDATIALVNTQMQLGLSIGGPALQFLIGIAPFAIVLLYSDEFIPASEILQWQTIGNIFKLASWPLGFVVVAMARSNTFLLLQVSFNLVFLLLLWPMLTPFGVWAVGPSFSFAYIIQFIIVLFVVRRLLGFRCEPATIKLLALHVGLSVTLLVLALFQPTAAALIAPVAALGTGVFGLRVVLSKANADTLLERLFSRSTWLVGKRK